MEEDFWDFMITKLQENIDDFEIRKREDKFGCYRYEWKCRDDSGKRVVSESWYDTPKECLLDFLKRIEGFWFG